MNRGFFLMLVLSLTLTIIYAQRPDGEGQPDGDTGGERPDGMGPDGERPDGMRPDGERPDGERPDKMRRPHVFADPELLAIINDAMEAAMAEDSCNKMCMKEKVHEAIQAFLEAEGIDLGDRPQPSEGERPPHGDGDGERPNKKPRKNSRPPMDEPPADS